MKAAFQSQLNDEFEAGKDYKPNKADWLDGRWKKLQPVDLEQLRARRDLDPPRNHGRDRRAR